MSVTYLYATGHAEDVIGELRRALGQYSRRYDYIKIGITANPHVRFLQHQRKLKEKDKDDAWAKMIVIYETKSLRYAREVEKTLIDYARARKYKCEIWNKKGGGGGCPPKEGSLCYVYVLVD